jgi:class 3 adenylate cyclase
MSELVGGPELCAQLGDGGAFRVVQEHFELLRFVIEQGHGTLIKTDRDSVLASFPTSEAAIRSAVAGQQAMASFRNANPQAASLSLRIGLYAGPCHLVTQNGRLDYYGQTLLLCSRLLREAHAGDILLPVELGEKAVATPGLRLGPRFVLTVKGIQSSVPVARLNIEQPTEREPSSFFRIEEI